MIALSPQLVARVLGGDVVGNRVSAPGPGHSRSDRSMVVFIDAAAPDGFRVHSHAGDDWRVCREHVARELGLPADRRHPGGDPSPASMRVPVSRTRDVAVRRQRRAVWIWEGAGDPTGTVVERYLAGRGLALSDDIAGDVLRFHPACPWSDGTVPAMVAVMRDISTGAVRAVHRTALAPDGTKLGRRMLGVTAGTAIMLDASANVALGLTVGEGIETCLAGRQLGLRPVWALGAVGAVRTFPVLAGVEALTILEETGDGGASAQAVREVGARWHHAGREVEIITPTVPGDLNDALLQGGARWN